MFYSIQHLKDSSNIKTYKVFARVVMYIFNPILLCSILSGTLFTDQKALATDPVVMKLLRKGMVP